MRLADTKPEHAPQDPFKTEFNKKQIKDNVASKIHTISHW